MLELVVSPPKLRLLRVLWGAGASQTGRELARAAGLDPKNATLALRALTDSGLVRRRRAGRAYLYSLNSENYIVSEILRHVFEGERNWLQALAAEVREVAGRRAEAVVLYGSWARNQAGPRSDIDLLIVVRSDANSAALEEKLDSHRLRLEERYGYPLSFLVITRSGLREKLRSGDRLMLDIVSQGRVLVGKPVSELVIHG